MGNRICIPNTLCVGFQRMRDTYTGLLAYITYYDNTGKLKRANSWHNLTDQNIEPLTITNEPTSGFVLNRHLDDFYGWNYKSNYIRVYDPRGFEFEITTGNLMYILENTNYIVGKGLEGEFVYGWDKTELVLLPVNAPDYKKILDYNELIRNPEVIKNNDLVPGRTYEAKDGNHYTFLEKVTKDGKRKGNKFYFAEFINHYETFHEEFIDDYEFVHALRDSAFIVSFSDCNNRFIRTVDYNTHPKMKNLLYKMQVHRDYCGTPKVKIMYNPYTEDELKKELIKSEDLSLDCYINYKRAEFCQLNLYGIVDITYDNGNVIYEGKHYTIKEFVDKYIPSRKNLVDVKTNEIIEYDFKG